MNLFEQYEQAKTELAKAKNTLDDIQAQLYTLYIEEIDAIDYGKTFSTETSGFKVKIVKKETITVDQKLADELGFGFTKKYSFSKKAYTSMISSDKKRVDECLTSSPSKPTFTVERL